MCLHKLGDGKHAVTSLAYSLNGNRQSTVSIQLEMCLRLTDRRSAAGRALDHFSNQEDRDKPAGPLERLVIPPLVRARICSPIGSKTAGAGPSGFGSARGVPLALPRCTLRRCNLNRGAPPRLQRCRSFSSASSHRTRSWRQRDRDRLPLWSERSA